MLNSIDRWGRTLEEHAQEEGAYIITISWTDEDGAAVTPSAASWTLSDEKGNIVNSRTGVAIPALSTSNEILLAGDDLKLSGYKGNRRAFAVSYTYTSASHGAVTQTGEVYFMIDNLVNVP